MGENRNALKPGFTLLWYELQRVLGQGGFGITYLARDTNLDQQVAIKEYFPGDLAVRDENGQVTGNTAAEVEQLTQGLARFIGEARTLSRFDHPSIARILSVFEANGTAYMVMRYEHGESLAAVLERRRRLPEDDLLRIVLPILDGLRQVHAAGFIHRDIQPANIYLRADGSPVLLDFGAARETPGRPRTLTILVAPGYAPFEQYYASSQEQGPWTDIYGLGATLYRAVAGVPPLDAIERSRGMLGSTRDMLVPAVVAGQGIYSEPFLRAIDHALMFGEKDRPQSVDEWIAELRGEPTQPATMTEHKVSIHESPGQRAAGQHAIRRQSAGIPLAATVALFACGIAIGALALRWWAMEEPVAPDSEPAIAQAVPEPMPEPITIDVQPPAPDTTTEVVADDSSRLSDMLETAQDETQRLAQLRRELEQVQAQREAEQARIQALARAQAVNDPVVDPQAPVAGVVADADSVEADEAAAGALAFEQALAAINRSDYGEAINGLRPLAEQAQPHAQYLLGTLYRDGRGVIANERIAHQWLLAAAQAGDADAAVALARMYLRGIDGASDDFLSFAWFLVAQQRGISVPVQELETARDALQIEQREHARRLAGFLQAEARG